MRRFIPYLLFLIGFLLVGGAIFYFIHTTQVPAAAANDIPAAISGFALSKKQTGAEAADSIKQLHLGDFSISSGIVAEYGRQNALLWVAQAPSASDAANLVTSMESSLAAGNPSFTPVGVFQFSGRDVYMLDGLGQSHFYFKSGSKVIWLTVDATSAEQALKELLAFYPD